MGGALVQDSEGVWSEPLGHSALWLWFGLSRSAWLTLPRVMVHEMPDEWQAQMAKLLGEWDVVYQNKPNLDTCVTIRRNGRMCKMPAYLTNYRHPDVAIIEAMKLQTYDFYNFIGETNDQT